MKKTLKIIGLISLSLSLVAVIIDSHISKADHLNVNLPTSVTQTCLKQVEEVNRSNWLEDFDKDNLVSVKTLRNELGNLSECANSLNYQEAKWREAWFILQRMPPYQPVPTPVKQVLKDSVLEMQAQLQRQASLQDRLKLTPSEKNRQFWEETLLNFWVGFCLNFAMLMMLYYIFKAVVDFGF